MCEAFELDNHDLGHFVYFNLFVAISVGLTSLAIVLVITSKQVSS